ncbi:universal stress protein [Haladaptatus sp. DYF46]|uniref:universal stress protein n=1 Tax=unclassified Haladaptatus TaxID=2622732 RepID=UPI001E28B786|nr:universal stress protein [Haladaptatus sp. DYF46]
MTILTAVGEELHSNGTISVGYDLATTYDEQLVVLHVIPKEDFNKHKAAVKGTPAYNNFAIGREEQSGAEIAYRAVHESLDDYDPDRVETRGRVGNPAEKILAEVEQSDPRYLVIGGKRRSPVGKAIFGSTAQSVLMNASCPVVSMVSGGGKG